MSDTIEDGLYAYLSSQTTISDIVEDRIYPSVLPQKPTLPAVVFHNLGGEPVSRIDGRPCLERTRFQVDCYAKQLRSAKLLANAIRDELESYVGLMGTIAVRAVFVVEHGVDDFDDVPDDFRIMSEYEIWHVSI